MNREVVLEAMLRIVVHHLHNADHSEQSDWQKCRREPCAAVSAVLVQAEGAIGTEYKGHSVRTTSLGMWNQYESKCSCGWKRTTGEGIEVAEQLAEQHVMEAADAEKPKRSEHRAGIFTDDGTSFGVSCGTCSYRVEGLSKREAEDTAEEHMDGPKVQHAIRTTSWLPLRYRSLCSCGWDQGYDSDIWEADDCGKRHLRKVGL